MTSESYIFLAGASRGIGREIAKYLIAENYQVMALLRSFDAKPELEAMGIKVVIGDALDIASVETVMLGEENIATVISTIGGLPKDVERADYLGNKNLTDIALKAKVQQFILISSIGTGESAVALPPQALETLGPVLLEKEKAEQHLINSGLTYTIIRPGGLKSELATGNGVLTQDFKIAGSIHREDVAQLTCKCLTSKTAKNQILSAVDRNMIYSQLEYEEFCL